MSDSVKRNALKIVKRLHKAGFKAYIVGGAVRDMIMGVEPEDYENVRDQVIAALYDYVEPNTGKKPFSLILRKEDARILGLYGDRIGDVVYAVRGEFMGQHGCLLTTAEYGIGSLKPLFTIMGPNIKKGIALERNVWLTDLIPTICYLMGIPLPRDAEGAIIFQAMEDPNFRLIPA